MIIFGSTELMHILNQWFLHCSPLRHPFCIDLPFEDGITKSLGLAWSPQEGTTENKPGNFNRTRDISNITSSSALSLSLSIPFVRVGNHS